MLFVDILKRIGGLKTWFWSPVRCRFCGVIIVVNILCCYKLQYRTIRLRRLYDTLVVRLEIRSARGCTVTHMGVTFVIKVGGGHGERWARAYNRVLGAEPQRVQAAEPWSGVRGRSLKRKAFCRSEVHMGRKFANFCNSVVKLLKYTFWKNIVAFRC